MKYFLKKLLGHEIFRSMVSCATNFFFEKFVKPSGPPSFILNVRSLKAGEFFILRKRLECAPLRQPQLQGILFNRVYNHQKLFFTLSLSLYYIYLCTLQERQYCFLKNLKYQERKKLSFLVTFGLASFTNYFINCKSTRLH